MPKFQRLSNTTQPTDDTMCDRLALDDKVTEFVDEFTEKDNAPDTNKTGASLPGGDRVHVNSNPPLDPQLSAIRLEQEPSTLKKNVTEAILDAFPDYSPEDMIIEPTNGGVHNHVVDIILRKVAPKFPWYTLKGFRNIVQPCLTGRKKPEIKPKHFVLRVPRYHTRDMYHRVIILNYLRHRLAYPVPKVVIIDSTPHNSLGSPYMLQEWLPGRPLDEIWATLNHAQRLSSMRAVSTLLLELRKVKNKCPGIISIRNTTYDLKHDLIRTEPIPIPSSSGVAATSDLSGPQTTKDFLLDLCERQRAYSSASSLLSCKDLWSRINKMIHTLHNLGLIPDSEPFYLYHGDMRPRNILVDITSDTNVRITGILDWDSALFAPAFMSMRAPLFGWSRAQDERDALMEPQDKQLREIKREFESVVGEQFLKCAYRRELVLARCLWGALTKGVTCGDDVWVVEEALSEFANMHPLE